MKKQVWIFIHVLTLLIVVSCNDKPSSLDEIFDKISSEPQIFNIDPTVENLIEGKAGTKLLIPAYSFSYIDGSPIDSMVTIHLTEIYSRHLMISNNLTTTSNNRILESGGMVNLQASANEMDLKIANGKSLVLTIPDDEKKAGMKIFYGATIADKVINWKVNKKDSELNNRDAVTPSKIETKYSYKMEYAGWHQSYYKKDIKHNISLNTLALKKRDLTVERFMEENQYLSQSEIKEIFESDSNKIEVRFKIDDTGKFYDAYMKSGFNPEIDNSTIEYFESFPEVDLVGSGKSLEGYIEFGLTLRAFYREDKELFIKEFNQKYRENRNGTLKKMNVTDLNNYVFSVTKLGWINCDRFIDSQENINFTINLPNLDDVKVYMIFKDINSILIGTRQGNEILFSQVPKNRNVEIIGIGVIAGKPSIASKEAQINNELFFLNEFKEVDIEELKTKLQSIN